MNDATENRGGRPPGAAVELRGYSLAVAGRPLLENAEAAFPAGQVSLIVGASGVGKSLLLRALAGLVVAEAEPVCVSGEATIGGEPIDATTPTSGAGVVFQHFALFVELSPAENVAFARSHRRRPARGGEVGRRHAADSQSDLPGGDPIAQAPPTTTPASPPATRPLLDELHVPTNVPTAALSGGQKQRLAIARALAYDPAVLFYDEPTSGLDAATAAKVAALINRTHAAHPRTSIVVTHDYQALTPIADKVYLFDGDARRLVEMPHDEWESIALRIKPPDPGEAPVAPNAKPRVVRALGSLAAAAAAFFAATGRAAEAAALAPWRLVPVWRSPYWGVRFLAHYLRLAAGPSAWLYLAIAGAIIGYVSTYFSFRFLPYAQFTRPLLTEELLTSIGFALFRVFTPILATILIAARCGAAAASDVGGKTYGRQIDAMRSLGASPKRYLLTNILWSFLLGTPLLAGVAYLSAAAASLAVFTATHPEKGPWFWRRHFHRALAQLDSPWFVGAHWLLAKILACAVGIALIAYHQGARPKNSPRDVSRGITATILWATLYVLVVHFAFAFFEFEATR